MRPGEYILALLLAANLLAAEGVSIIYLRNTDPINLNPWQAEDNYSNEITSNIFEGLVRFKKNSTAVEPCLATSWNVSEDGKNWRFNLRRGVTFHDGRPFNARSVIDSYQSRLGKNQSLYRRLNFPAPFITEIRSSGPYSVEFILDRPYAPFLIALADSAAFIQMRNPDRTAPYVPIGTGPFRFSSWIKGKSLILTRHPGYWTNTGNVEKIIFKVMPDSLARLLQIKNGSADITTVQSAKELEELSLRSEIKIISYQPISIHYLAFNTRKKPFDRKAIRAVFQHIISKENMVKQVFQKLAEPAYSSLPPPIYPAGKATPSESFDLQAARMLLKKEGLKNGFDCTLHFPNGQDGIEEFADLLVIYGKKVKINIKKIKLPFAELIKLADRAEHDLLLMGWTSNPDPDFFLYPLFTFSASHHNRFFYENADLTRLLDLGKITRDVRKRSRIYLEALAILKRDIPWIPLFHAVRTKACSSKITGLGFNPLGQMLFRDANKESIR